MIAAATRKGRGEVDALIAHYQRLHWGLPPHRIIHVDDPLVPDASAMGALVALYLVDGDGEHVALDFPEHGSFLAVHEPTERLYMIAPQTFRRQCKREFDRLVRDVPQARVTLPELAAAAPGVQARKGGWPRIDATALGITTHILYFTDKQGDGPSTYIHAFGEESGRRPLLAADYTGRVWLAGGDYTTPPEGITN